MLVSLEEARRHLRVDDDDDDISLYLGAAEEAAIEFLNRRVYADADSLADAVLDGTAGESPMIVNKSVKAAILLILGDLYKHRENSTSSAVNEVSTTAKNLLQPYREQMGV